MPASSYAIALVLVLCVHTWGVVLAMPDDGLPAKAGGASSGGAFMWFEDTTCSGTPTLSQVANACFPSNISFSTYGGWVKYTGLSSKYTPDDSRWTVYKDDRCTTVSNYMGDLDVGCSQKLEDNTKVHINGFWLHAYHATNA